jgi:hypothetical protein
MKESYDEGLTNHIVSESCAGSGNRVGEALTGECAGWVLSSESVYFKSCADAIHIGGRQHRTNRQGEGCTGAAGSETPCMHGRTTYGNREALCLPLQGSGEGRIANLGRVRQ